LTITQPHITNTCSLLAATSETAVQGVHRTLKVVFNDLQALLKRVVIKQVRFSYTFTKRG